jgi:hypothetical protein
MKMMKGPSMSGYLSVSLPSASVQTPKANRYHKFKKIVHTFIFNLLVVG